MELTAQARELVNGNNFAIIATLNADGSPQESVVWTRERDGEVIFSTVEGRAKYRNLRRDPRIAVLILDANNPQRYSEVRGAARIEPDPNSDLIAELSLKYDDKPWVEGATTPRVIVAVRPEHITEHE